MDSPTDPTDSGRRRKGYSKDEILLLRRIDKSSLSYPGALADELNQPPAIPTPTHWQLGVRRWACRASLLLFLGSIGLLAASKSLAHGNALCSAICYLPAWWLVMPAWLALMMTAPWQWRLNAALGAVLLGSLLWADHWQWPTAAPQTLKDDASLRLLSWNRGQGKGASLRAMIAETQPDVIALQDAKVSYYLNNPQYQDYPWISGSGEFVILSRHPVDQVEEVKAESRSNERQSLLWGLRCRVDFRGRTVELVNLHAPSPRRHLTSLLRGRALLGLLSLLPVEAIQQRSQQTDAYWQPYLDFFHRLASRAITSSQPQLLIGDFNTPPCGPIHRALTEVLTDCHLEAGSGFGHTFPGNYDQPLTLFQPWLRLDAAYASKHWQTLRCIPLEHDAQHLPLYVELKLKPQASAP